MESWQKWKELVGVLCDDYMPNNVKGNGYKIVTRPVMMCGAEAWTVTRRV